ncbi:hypothetical protein V6N12_009928 [Hibiscus sabdariffa]|uniref:Uncharacterized protein n=1 Tax=Hibiscus sabdariffa TaxID=183260 RepID=A0ABR2EC62_9ROSI
MWCKRLEKLTRLKGRGRLEYLSKRLLCDAPKPNLRTRRSTLGVYLDLWVELGKPSPASGGIFGAQVSSLTYMSTLVGSYQYEVSRIGTHQYSGIGLVASDGVEGCALGWLAMKNLQQRDWKEKWKCWHYTRRKTHKDGFLILDHLGENCNLLAWEMLAQSWQPLA